jgi:tetratricopeptide (TPR) repeat protein
MAMFRVELTIDGTEWRLVGEYDDRAQAEQAARDAENQVYYPPAQLQSSARIIEVRTPAPRTPRQRFWDGIELESTGQDDDALAAFADAASEPDLAASSRGHIADLHARAGRSDEAIAEYCRALRAEPRTEELELLLLRRLAEVYVRTGEIDPATGRDDLAAARACLRRILERRPDDAWAAQQLRWLA